MEIGGLESQKTNILWITLKRYQILGGKIFFRKNILSCHGRLARKEAVIFWLYHPLAQFVNILNYLEKNLSKENFNKVKIRGKPKEPIVDKNGKYLGLKVNEDVRNNSLEDDLNKSSIVIAYNSQVALDASLRGLPVIVNQHNSCNAISFKLSDLKGGINNSIFDQEPERKKLFKWLAYCQFKFSEIKNGFAWKTISNFQI